ncbi:MAG: sigma-E processing peptidase SpoIIGA [Oscillospiraceae bacterium]|nr:sigma-E processing peptidase SpoIIGA [Oscillospiraceae bacterium]
MGVVYIDLLIIINLYITFFLIKATSVFLHRQITTKRVLLGALVGGASSLIILLPPLLFLFNALIKIVVGSIIVLIAFGYKTGYEYMKNSLIFIIINVVFAGFTLMLCFFASPLGMTHNNGIVYFNISFTVLIITTISAYVLIRLLRYAIDARSAGDRTFTITFTRSGKTVTLSALADTGNMLTDYFSGLPVIICPPLLSDLVMSDNNNAIPPRLLPYNTISSSGLIPVYKADEIIIKSDNMPDKSVKALIGISENDAPAIFNPKLLI